MTSGSIRFQCYELQPAERRLLVDGVPAALGARAFDVLVLLASRAGSLVSKSSLLDEVWPGLVVEENNIQVQISTLRRVLGSDVIATVPGRGYRFTATVEEGAVASGALGAARAAAPAPALFGRAEDEAAVAGLAAEVSVVTLVGAGGVGKTSLARALLQRWRAAGEAAHWVDLAALEAAERLPQHVATALGLPAHDPAALAEGLAGLGSAHVVLDNAEHLLADVAAFVETHAANADALRWLVTSQAPLGIAAEHVHRLATLEQTAARALFAERARAAGARLAPDEATRSLVEDICRTLEGLPLAIEMAASRVPHLGLKGLKDALQRGLGVLASPLRHAPARQRTLQAALAWSHGLLPPDEARLFRRLAVMPASFPIALVPPVAGEDGDDAWQAIDRLAHLVDRSLVAVEPGDPPRYRLLETMRAFALDRLQVAGEEPALRQRHAEATTALFREAAHHLAHGSGTVEERLALGLAEIEHARAALAWCLPRAPALTLELAALAARFTAFSAWRGPSQQWLEDGVPWGDDPAVPLAIRADWSSELARLRLFAGLPSATPAARQALALFAELGDDYGQYRAAVALARSTQHPDTETHEALARMQALLDRHPEWPVARRAVAIGTHATVALYERNLEQAYEYRRQEAALAAEAGNVAGVHAARTAMLTMLASLGRLDEATAMGVPLVEELRRAGDTTNLAYGAMFLIDAYMQQGRVDEAAGQVPTAWTAARGTSVAPVLGVHLVGVALHQGRLRDAALLLGWAVEAHARSRMTIEDDVVALRDTYAATLRERLGEVAFETCAAQGRGTSDDAIEALATAAVA